MHGAAVVFDHEAKILVVRTKIATFLVFLKFIGNCTEYANV